MTDIPYDAPEIRLCHLVKWPDFNGYGFNLHAEKGKAGQYIGKVDEDSPAEYAHLQPGDRIVEVNGVNIGNENHQQVVGRVKAGGDETRLLVLSSKEEEYYKDHKIVVTGELPNVKCYSTPAPRPVSSPDGETGEKPVNGDVHTEDQVEPQVERTTEAVAAVLVTDTQPDEDDTTEQEPFTEREPSPVQNDEPVIQVSHVTEVNEPPPEFDDIAPVYDVAMQQVNDAEPVDVVVPDEPEEDYHTYETPDPPREPSPEPQVTTIVVPPLEAEPVREPSPEPFREPTPPPREPTPPPREPTPPPREPTPPPREPTPPPSPAPAQTNGDPGGLKLGLTAAEMRDQLKSKKKKDPRAEKASFQSKYEVFQRL